MWRVSVMLCLSISIARLPSYHLLSTFLYIESITIWHDLWTYLWTKYLSWTHLHDGNFFLENVEIFGKKSMHGREKDDGILRNQKRIFYEFNDPKRRYEGRRFSGCLPNEACINFFHAINSKQKCTGIKAIRNRLK